MHNPLRDSSYYSYFGSVGFLEVDALANELGTRWGPGGYTPVNLSYSFPWANGASASWSNNYGSEINASVRFGLNNTQQAAVRTALKAWSNVCNITFTEVADTASFVGELRFAFSSAVNSQGAGVWGYDRYPGPTPQSGDTWISPDVANRSWAPGSYNLLAIMHEIGHGLGLKHPGDYNAGGGGTPGPYLPRWEDAYDSTIMSYNAVAGQTGASLSYNPTTPMLLDIMAMQDIYGFNLDYNLGDTTYTFDDSTPYNQTIWDAGGNNSIVYTGLNASTINLTPGIGSKIGIPVTATSQFGASLGTINNVWIAYATTIDNATGGRGNDTINGNENNNVLMGSGGNDIIDGAKGSDTVLYAGRKSNFTVTKSGNSYIVRDTTGAEGTDTVSNVESIKFADTASFAIDLATATLGQTVTARGASDASLAIALQMAVVYLGRPIGSSVIQNYAGQLAGGQPSAAVLGQMASLAISDGAFKSTDTSKDIVVHTFNNIMGFLPSAFEQNAWSQYIDNGTLTRTNAPWVIFQSYLGASNVPDIYKLPTQARFVAAQTFSDYTLVSSQIDNLNSLNSKYAAAARAWLSPINSITAASNKMKTMVADINTVTLVGTAPAAPEPIDLFNGY